MDKICQPIPDNFLKESVHILRRALGHGVLAQSRSAGLDQCTPCRTTVAACGSAEWLRARVLSSRPRLHPYCYALVGRIAALQTHPAESRAIRPQHSQHVGLIVAWVASRGCHGRAAMWLQSVDSTLAHLW